MSRDSNNLQSKESLNNSQKRERKTLSTKHPKKTKTDRETDQRGKHKNE